MRLISSRRSKMCLVRTGVAVRAFKKSLYQIVNDYGGIGHSLHRSIKIEMLPTYGVLFK